MRFGIAMAIRRSMRVHVLRIGLTRPLASHATRLARMLATSRSMEWCRFVPPPWPAEGEPVDLFIELARQPGGPGPGGTPRKSDRLMASWPSIPDDARALELAVHKAARDAYGFIVGYSPAMHDVCRWCRALADQISLVLDLRGLIVGETGTGKELVARSIHRLGGRGGEFVPVNCAGIPGDLMDSELFGHTRGAFTGAMSARQGAIARAGKGVLFLDEIADLPFDLQGKLLRVLESRQFTPVGGDRSVPVTGQVVAATNQPIAERVREGRFRADLFFRLAQIQVRVPALRERSDDIPLLMDAFLRPHGLGADRLDRAVLFALSAYRWPGNIRELRSVVERYVVMRRAGEPVDSVEWWTRAIAEVAEVAGPASPSRSNIPDATGSDTLQAKTDHFQRDVLRAVLVRCNWDTAEAAKELGVTRRTVYNLMNKFALKRALG